MDLDRHIVIERPCADGWLKKMRIPETLLHHDHEERFVESCMDILAHSDRICSVFRGGVRTDKQIRERSPMTWVLWMHAGSTARLGQSFQDIADFIGILGQQDPKANVFRLVHDWLRDGKNGRWLLILDNVDSPDLLFEARDASQRGQGTGVDSEGRQPMSAYLPRSQNGSILVTSRSKEVALNLVEEKDIVAVAPMAAAHALSLFEKKLGPVEPGDDTAELATSL